MRITLLTIGSQGDIRPYIALGNGLQKQGYQVKLATHREFEAIIRAQGLDFFPVKGNPREILEGALGQDLLASGANIFQFLKKFRAAAAEAMRGGFDDCLAACEDAQAVIAPFFVMPIALEIANHLDIPLIQAFLQPVTPTGAFPVITLPTIYLGGFLNKLSHRLGEQVFWQTFRQEVENWRKNSLRKSKALPWWGPMGQLRRRKIPLLYGFSRYLVPKAYDWPDFVHVTGFWFLELAEIYTPSAELLTFMADGPPPFYVGFGSMSNADPQAFCQEIIQALEKTQQRAILLTGWKGLIPVDHPRIFYIDAIPHDWLFPQMAGIIHHGGAGTIGAALRAGVPQIIVPYFGDQPFWAQRIFGYGLGPRPIPRKYFTGDKLAESITQVINQPRYAKRADELGKHVRAEQGVEKAVSLIQTYLNQASER